jgi:hypothetical protein
LTSLTYYLAFLVIALEMADVKTPSCRATSAKKNIRCPAIHPQGPDHGLFERGFVNLLLAFIHIQIYYTPPSDQALVR